MSILTFIFLLFPSFLKEVLKMDPYKLGVLCVFIACLIYWIYFLIISIRDRNKSGDKRIRFIINPVDGAVYLVDGSVCSHIPDMATFKYLKSYFGFTSDVEEMLIAEIKRKFAIKSDVPSITLHFTKP
jgi:hypothetical protein